MRNVLGDMNYWAILVSGIVFWLIGTLWFSVIIGKSWAHEMGKHGVKIKLPTPGEMVTKSIWTFIFNLVVAFGISFLVYNLNITTFADAIYLGLILSLCIAAAVMIISYIWESRSFKLSFYDIFYPVIGIIISSVIITLWI